MFQKDTILVSILSFIVGGVFVWLIFSYKTEDSASSKALRLWKSEYPLINSILMCNVDGSTSNENKAFESEISKFIESKKSNGEVVDMSVYFVDYKKSQWAGVNQNERYDPASMLKVPVMMAYYEQAQSNPKILSETTSFNGDDQNSTEFFKSENNIKPGVMYKIDDLINSMIINSDNNALVLLQFYLGKDLLSQVYTDLNLPVPPKDNDVEYLSVKSYAYFFRVLYNATYLSKDYSERALELLAKSKVSGIRDGVPEGTKVSQKFGERSVYDQSGNLVTRELHDCGIVYKPDSPYLICIMSRGKSDFNTLMKNIKDLSAIAYKEAGKN
jgi:beta-lactamase class A